MGSPVGSEEFVCEFMSSKVDGWIEEMARLGEIGLSQPHAVFSGHLCVELSLVHNSLWRKSSLVCKESFCRCFWEVGGPKVRRMVALPARLGGL